MSKPIVRFAPSPTGLHPYRQCPHGAAQRAFRPARGRHLRPALRRYRSRSARKREYADAIEADLAWLGIPPDMVVRQSERFALYDDAAERLRDSGGSMPATRPPDELEFRRKRQLARGLPPIYDRAALKLSAEDRARLEGGGAAAALALPARSPHRGLARPRARRRPTSIAPRCRTRCWCARTAPISTRCPRSSTTSTSAITHVIRGEDHVTNTAVQIQIFEALGRARAGLRATTTC